jgi:hypothetical protein
VAFRHFALIRRNSLSRMAAIDPLLTVATGCFAESETTDNGLIGAGDSRMPSMSVPARNRAGGDLRKFFIAHQSSLSRAGLKCEPVSGRVFRARSACRALRDRTTALLRHQALRDARDQRSRSVD